MITFKVTGLKEIQDKLLRSAQKELYESIMKEAAENAKILARNFAPVDTGRMEGGIKYIMTDDGFMLECTVPWAVYNEFGTMYMPVGDTDSPLNVTSTSGKNAFRPFMRPALHVMVREDFPEIFRKHFFEIWK